MAFKQVPTNNANDDDKKKIQVVWEQGLCPG